MDHQIQVKTDNEGIVINYLGAILSQIIYCLKISKITSYDWHIFLHDGDFLKDPKGKEVDFDNIPVLIRDRLSKKDENLKIDKFSHDRGHLIWDLVLNNKEIIEILKNQKNPEEYLLGLVNPSIIDKSFFDFINK